MGEIESREIYEYQIGTKTYIMKPLVLGQVKLISNLLKDRFPDTGNLADKTVLDLVNEIQDILPEAFAIILIEKGSEADTDSRKLKDRNLKEIAEEIEFCLDLDVAIEVCNDFFVCTPLISAFQTLMGMVMPKLGANVGGEPITESKTESTGLTESSSTSAEETSSGEMKSSGDTP